MKQPEWQRGGICGALSSTSQQLNIEPSEQRERASNQSVVQLSSQFEDALAVPDVINME